MVQSKRGQRRANRIGLCRSDRVYYAISYAVIALLTLLVLYPLVYIVSASFSSASAVNAGRVWLFPVQFSTFAYENILKYPTVWLGYGNTLFYTFFGTLINITLTLLCAYPLSRQGLPGRGFFMFLFTFTMLFSGGMIPSYLLMRDLHLLDTRWAMLLPGAMSVYNMIVTRTFIESTIPSTLLEASKLDGCSNAKYFLYIVLPLSTTVIAVIALFYAVGHWNAYFNAFLYLSKKELYPLQIFLRQILVQSNFETDMLADPEMVEQLQGLQTLLKYAVIVVATVPLFFFYPFAQRHFASGVMIGSIKG